MARKTGGSTIGHNPLDPVVPSRAAPQAAAPSSTKRAVTVRLSGALLERLQGAVYWTPGATVTSLIEEALSDSLDKREKANGGRFNAPAGPIKTGRRAGS